MEVVHSNATLTSTGSRVMAANAYADQSLTLVVNIKASPTGTAPTITFSIQEVDPGDGATAIGPVYTGQVLNAIGVTSILMPTMIGNQIKVTWTVTGSASPSFTQVYATLVSKTTPGVRRSLSATYAASSDTVPVSSGTTGTTTISLGYLFHPSSVTGLIYRLQRIVVTWTDGGGGAGALLKLAMITAENGTPGGNLVTPVGLNQDSVASNAIFRTGAATPTRAGLTIDTASINLGAAGCAVFYPPSGADGQEYELRKSQAEGWEVRLVVSTPPTTAASFSISANWREEPV